jgi:hypothetical protein
MLMDPEPDKITTTSTQFLLPPTKLRDDDLSIPKAGRQGSPKMYILGDGFINLQ